MVIVQLHEVDIEHVGKQLFHSGHLSVLTNTAGYTDECWLTEQRKAREGEADVSARIPVPFAVHQIF